MVGTVDYGRLRKGAGSQGTGPKGRRLVGHRLEDDRGPDRTLFEAFARESIRDQWLPGVELHLRTANAPTSARYDWADGSTRLIVSFERLSASRSRVALEHERLPYSEVADRMKVWWRDRVTDLKKLPEAA